MMDTKVDAIHGALLGTMEHPEGALAKIENLVEWKETRQNDLKTLTFRLVSFIGGIIFMAVLAIIGIAKHIVG